MTAQCVLIRFAVELPQVALADIERLTTYSFEAPSVPLVRSFFAGGEAVPTQAAGPDRINVTASERRVRQGTR